MTLDPQTILDNLLEKMDLILAHPVGTTVELFSRKESLTQELAAWRNLSELDLKGEDWTKLRERLGRLIMKTNDPLVISNLQADPNITGHGFLCPRGLSSYLGLLLAAKGEKVGILGFYTKDEYCFEEGEVAFLSALADQAAVAIDNALIYTEAKRQAVELEKSSGVKTELLSVMSHEVSTPLTAIMGYTEMLHNGTYGEVNEAQREVLFKVLQHSKDLLDIFNGILGATKIESQQLKVVTRDVNLKQLLDELKLIYHGPLKKNLPLRGTTHPTSRLSRRMAPRSTTSSKISSTTPSNSRTKGA